MTIADVMQAAGFAPTDYEVHRFYYHGIPLTEWDGCYLLQQDTDKVEPKLVSLLFYGVDVDIVLRPELPPLYVLLFAERGERQWGTLRLRDE